MGEGGGILGILGRWPGEYTKGRAQVNPRISGNRVGGKQASES